LERPAGFLTRLHIFDMHIDQFGERIHSSHVIAKWRLAAINHRFHLHGPFPRMLLAQKGFNRDATFAPDLDLPVARR